MIVRGDARRIWGIPCLPVLRQAYCGHLPGGTEKHRESPQSGYRVPVEVRTWGILNVKYYRDPPHLKIINFKLTGEVQSYCCGNTTSKYEY